MKKLFLLVVVSICIAIQASAQTPIKYQGEVDLGYSVGVECPYYSWSKIR